MKCHEQFGIDSMGRASTNFGLNWCWWMVSVLLNCIWTSEYTAGIDSLLFLVTSSLVTDTPIIENWRDLDDLGVTSFGKLPLEPLQIMKGLEGTVSLDISQLQIRYWSQCLALGGGSKPAGNWRMLWLGSKNEQMFCLNRFNHLSSFIYRGWIPLRIISNPAAY